MQKWLFDLAFDEYKDCIQTETNDFSISALYNYRRKSYNYKKKQTKKKKHYV